MSGLSGLSPPLGENKLSLAAFIAKSVRVWRLKSNGIFLILSLSVSVLYSFLSANVNWVKAFRLNVTRPKWSPSGLGLKWSTNSTRNAITFFKLYFLTLWWDASTTTPISKLIEQGGPKIRSKDFDFWCLHYNSNYFKEIRGCLPFTRKFQKFRSECKMIRM